ncbi:MAG: glutathione-disulfide reductase [Hyphomicrobiales bacterium]|nr:glutathione-disulfide reductase [Hyphomicrobiales bacterium]
MAFDVDFFVIGAGSGGVRAARVAAMHGAKTLIAEESRVGGTCVIRGCVPKKLYVYASRFADDFADAAGFGWSVGAPTFDWPSLVAAKEKEITRLSAAYRANLAASGAELIEERATVVAPQRVRLASGPEVSARHILVAVGSWPTFLPGVEGLEHAITSNEAFDLPVFPRRLLVVGGGYIAVEFASLFQRLGAQVIHVMRASNVLRGFDEDMREGVRAAMERAGVMHRFGILPAGIEKRPDGALRVTLTDGEMFDADRVLVATGRLPNTRGLGLETAGLKLSQHGAIKVDDELTSAVASIHAIGDVTHRVNLTPVAIREGHALADRLFGAVAKPIRYDTIAHVVFGTPELAAVGLSEAEAVKRFPKVDVYKSDFRPMTATLSGSGERTIMKLVADGATDRIVGAHILAHDAGEMVQLVAVAMTIGATKADFDATMAVHPTAAEELVTMHAPALRYENGRPVA